MPTVLLVNPPKKNRAKSHKPKARKNKAKSTPRTSPESSHMAKKNKSKSTPKKRSGKSKAVAKSGFGGAVGSRAFLNTDLLVTGAVAGAGFLGATIIAPKIGSMASGMTGGFSEKPTGQIIIKAGAGLATHFGVRRFAPKYGKYGTALAVGMIASAAVDLWDLYKITNTQYSGNAGSNIQAGTGVAGYFGPSGASVGNTGNVYVPYGVRMAA